MRRRRFLGLAAGLGAASVTAACGVPSSSDPIRLGNAPTQGPPETDVRMPRPPQDARTVSELVGLFLNAASGANTVGGERPKAMDQARTRMKDFFTAAGGAQWQPSVKVLVVRATPKSPVATTAGDWTVGVDCVPLGYLDDHGDLSPVPNVPFMITFTVVSVGSIDNHPQWRVQALDFPDNTPVDLLLADTALHEWYDTFAVYFWDPDVDTLVPELRYMPAVISSAKRPAEIVRWLTAGPSPWLNILKPLPPEVEIKDPHWDADALHLTLNLGSKAANLDPDVQRKFAVQVWWSLHQGTVELTIEGAATGIRINEDAALSANAAARVEDDPAIEKFCIIDHKVHETDGQTPALLVPAGSPNPNTDVVLAAITRNKKSGALVRVEGKQQHLWLGTITGTTSETQASVYVPTALVGKQFSRPVWIGRPQRLVMVVVDGKLMTVNPTTPNAPGVEVIPPRGLAAGQITAFAVAPDGRRIAFISGGQVVVAPMVFSDSNTVGILDTYRIVYTPLVSPNAVGWEEVLSLVIGGAPGGSAESSLVSVALSSAIDRTLPSLSFTVEQISTSPINAKLPLYTSTPLIMVQAGGVAYNVYQTEIRSFDVPSLTPTPSPSPSATPPPPLAISSPFFLD